MDSSDLKFTGAIRVPQQVRRSVVTGSRCAGRDQQQEEGVPTFRDAPNMLGPFRVSPGTRTAIR
jgi:hypothetical protein